MCRMTSAKMQYQSTAGEMIISNRDQERPYEQWNIRQIQIIMLCRFVRIIEFIGSEFKVITDMQDAETGVISGDGEIVKNREPKPCTSSSLVWISPDLAYCVFIIFNPIPIQC